MRAEGDSADVLVVEMDRTVPFVRKGVPMTLPVVDGTVRADTDRDALYVTVSERYGKNDGATVTAMINGFGLRSGAIASSAAPDDNNIICVGADRTDIALAVNHLSEHGGGQVVVENGEIKEFLPLPVAASSRTSRPRRWPRPRTAWRPPPARSAASSPPPSAS